MRPETAWLDFHRAFPSDSQTDAMCAMGKSKSYVQRMPARWCRREWLNVHHTLQWKCFITAAPEPHLVSARNGLHHKCAIAYGFMAPSSNHDARRVYRSERAIDCSRKGNLCATLQVISRREAQTLREPEKSTPRLC